MFENFYIYESELCSIAYEAGKYPECETGGDLYGLWTANGNPVVFLATGPGKSAIHQNAHYQMDIEYQKKCQTILMEQFGIHYLGDWHSHHNLRIYEPSEGDRQRIQNLFTKNYQVAHMAEIIVNHAVEANKREIISAYIYSKNMKYSNIKCMKSKNSPIREKVICMVETKYFNLIDGKLPINQVHLRMAGERIKEESYSPLEPLSKMKEKASIPIKLER